MAKMRKNYTIEIDNDSEPKMMDFEIKVQEAIKVQSNPLPYSQGTPTENLIANRKLRRIRALSNKGK